MLAQRRQHLLALVEDGDLLGQKAQRLAAAREALEPVVHGGLVPPGHEPEVIFGVQGLAPLGGRRRRGGARRRRIAQSILERFPCSHKHVTIMNLEANSIHNNMYIQRNGS